MHDLLKSARLRCLNIHCSGGCAMHFAFLIKSHCELAEMAAAALIRKVNMLLSLSDLTNWTLVS